MPRSAIECLEPTHVAFASLHHDSHFRGVVKDFIPHIRADGHFLLGESKPREQVPLTSASREDIGFQGKIEVDVMTFFDGGQIPMKKPRVEHRHIKPLRVIATPHHILFEGGFDFPDDPLIVAALLHHKGQRLLITGLQTDTEDAVVIPTKPGGFDIKEHELPGFFSKCEELLGVNLNNDPP